VNAADEIIGPALRPGHEDDPVLLYGDEVITYRDLHARVAQAGHALRALGLGRQDRLVMVVHDQPAFFYAYLGAMKIGAVPVALNLRASADDLLFAIQDSGCRLLLLDKEFVPLYRQIAARLPAPPRVAVADAKMSDFDSFAEAMDGQPMVLASESLKPDDMAFWMYTSGTTGTPKGAIHGVDAIAASDRFLGQVLRVGPGDRLFCSSKLFFAFSLGHVLMGALRLGAAAILYRDWPSPSAIAGVVERHRPTVMLSVPTLYAALLRDKRAETPAFRNVAHYVAAGERLPETIFAQWWAATGKPIIEGIGATENLMMFLANKPEEQRAGSCGLPLPMTEMRLMDDDGVVIEKPDQPGVGWVKSGSVARGYWNQPEKTAAAFRGGWYRTGDMFRRDVDGWYFHLGRSDDMLKVSGQWVSPGEIEDVVRAHPKVVDAAVVGVPNEDGFDRLSLCLVCSAPLEQHATVERELSEMMQERLSIYKCPRRFLFMDDLPRTATGKVQRFRLRQIAAG
jgi:benzoate-CoA ligase family protein